MSAASPKNRKRSRSSFEDATNSSFVKNVTSRVSGLLPVAVTKWFSSSSSSSNANGSTHTADTTDSSTEDESPESAITTEPPQKRKRYTTPAGYNHSPPESSFVKNVTSQVSGLLPVAVTKWFSSSSSSSANGSTQTADNTDSSTEDESPESPNTAEPPQKRKRYTTPAGYNHSPPELSYISSNIEQPEIDTCSPFHSLPGSSTFRRETNFVSTPLRPDLSDRAEKDSTTFKSDSHTVSKVTCSVAKKRNSLFSVPNRDEQLKKASAKSACNTVQDPKKPYFIPTLLGSPFYPGRTMYGGASSAYMNKPNIKQRKNVIVNECKNTDYILSQSTRRIMDILESYSSPLSDAKRIPQYTLTSGNHSQSSSNSSNTTPSNKTSYKTQELQVPRCTSLLKMKQISRFNEMTSAARQIYASHSSTSDYVPYTTPSQTIHSEQADNESSSKAVTKIKSRLSRPTRGMNKDSEIEKMPIPVSLPNAVLEIDRSNLPKFSFGASTATSTPKPISTQVTTEDNAKITETTLRKPDIVTSSQAPYKFSSPVTISSEAPESQIDATIPKFTFDSPERSIDKVNELKNTDDSCVVGPPKEPENKANFAEAKDWQCSDCWVFNKTDIEKCVCCGGKKPSIEKNNCSECKLADCKPNSDKCVNCDKKSTKSIEQTGLKPQEDASKWKCEDCWVNNDESTEKCVCCGSSKPNKVVAAKTGTMATTNSSEWKCDDCLIKNKDSSEKCAACGAARPGAVSAPGLFNSTYKLSDKAMTSIVKSQKEKWECPTCLVRNDSDKSKCICCEGERPGTFKESELKSFNFPTNANPTFKFGIPKSNETLNEQLATTNETRKEESETNNNILPKNTFTFGLPSNKSEDQTDTPQKTQKVDEASKSNASFGISTPQKSQKVDEAPKSNVSFGITVPNASAGVESSLIIPMLTTAQTKNNIGLDKVTLGLPSKKSEHQTYLAPPKQTEKVDDAPKYNFTFGIPKATTAEVPHASPVVEEPKNTLVQDKEKLQEVPTVTFALPKKHETLKSSPDMFTSTPTLETSTVKQTVLPPTPVSKPEFIVPNIFNSPVEKKDQSNTFNLQPAVSVSGTSNALSSPTPAIVLPPTSSSTPTPAFSFGTGGFKPAANLFGTSAPATTTAVPAMTFGSTLSAPTNSAPFKKNDLTATSSAMSLFSSKSDSPSSASLFPNAEAAASTTPAPADAAPAPLFSFGGSAQNATQVEKPKFNFSFGTNNKAETSAFFQPPTENKFSFGTPTENTFSFVASANNNALGGNGLSAGNALGGAAGSGGNASQLGNVLQTSGGLFGAQKENMWSVANNSNASGNLFVSNTATTTLQKPPTFPFASSTPFNAINSTPFNANNSTPAFGSTPQSPPNIFGMNQAANSVPSIFGSNTSNQSSGVVFGSPQQTQPPMFGSSSVGPTPPFGSPSASVAAPSPAPTFNFGASVPQATGVFGFGQQQTPAGAFNFGGASVGASPQVQFNMGSAPNTAVRRVRKAVRRTTPR